MNNCGEGKWNTCKEAKWDNQLNTELSKLKSLLYTLELKFKNLGLSDLKEFDSCLNPQAGDTIQFNGRTFNSKPNILGINSLVSEGIPIAEVVTGSGEIQTIYSPSNIKIAEDDSSPGDSLVNLRLLKLYIENLNTIINNLKDKIGEPEGNQTILLIIEQLQQEIELLKQNDCCATLETSITRLTDRVTALEGNNCCATLTGLIELLTGKVTALENNDCCETLGERIDNLEELIEGGGNTKFYTITNEIPGSKVNMKYVPEGETANILVNITGQYVYSDDVIFEYGDNTIQYSQQHNIVDTISYEISNVSNDIVIKLKENSERVNPYFVTYSISLDLGDDIKAVFYTPKVAIKPGETFTGYLTVDQDYTYTVAVVNSRTNEPVQFGLTQGGVVTVNNVLCNLLCNITLTKRSSDVVIVDEVAEVINRINNSTANHTRLLKGENYEIVVTLNTGYGLTATSTINITHGSTAVTNYNTKTVTSNEQQYIKQISFTINNVLEDVTIDASGGEVVSGIVETTRRINRTLTGVKLYGPYENPLQTIMNVNDIYEAIVSLDDPEGELKRKDVKIGNDWIDYSTSTNTIKVTPNPNYEGDLEITVEAESTPKATLTTTIPRTYIYQNWDHQGEYMTTRRVEANSSPLESIYFESNSGYNSNPGIELSSLYNEEESSGVIKITYKTPSDAEGAFETITALTPHINEETSETDYYIWTTANLPFEIHIHTEKDLENNDSEYVSEFSIYLKEDVESIEKDSTVTLSLADNISEDDTDNIITNYTQDTRIYVYSAILSANGNGTFSNLRFKDSYNESESYVALVNRSKQKGKPLPYVFRGFSWTGKGNEGVYPTITGQFIDSLGSSGDVQSTGMGTDLTVEIPDKYGIVYIKAYDGTGLNIDTCEVTINTNGVGCEYFGNYLSRDENTNTFIILRNAECAITVIPNDTNKVLDQVTDNNNSYVSHTDQYSEFKDSNMSTIKLHKTETDVENLTLNLTFENKSS